MQVVRVSYEGGFQVLDLLVIRGTSDSVGTDAHNVVREVPRQMDAWHSPPLHIKMT